MKNIVLALLILFTGSVSLAFDSDTRVVGSWYEFEVGSTELLYGDRVVLRAAASSESTAIDTLSIGSEVKIIEKTSEKITINGLPTNWYKVKCKAGKGYVAGGLIALDHREIDGVTYLAIVAGNEERKKVRCRVLKDGDFYGHESDLNTDAFYLEVFGNRGVEGIENMLTVNLFAEACGVDGGQIYLFNDGESLIEAISLVRVSDGGVFWFSEELIFPEDEDGWYKVIQYKREHGLPVDEEVNWYRSVVNTVSLEWKEGKLVPDVSELEFEDE